MYMYGSLFNLIVIQAIIDNEFNRILWLSLLLSVCVCVCVCVRVCVCR